MSTPTLTPAQEDALRETANVMIGNATTALARLTDERIDMDIPDVRILPWAEGLEAVAAGTDILAGIRTQIAGELTGEAYLTFDRRSALALADVLRGRPPGESQYVSSGAADALTEAGSIVVGACLSALHRFVEVRLVHDAPQFIYDRPAAIAARAPPATRGDPILLAKVTLEARGTNLRGALVLLFTLESLASLLKILEESASHP